MTATSKDVQCSICYEMISGEKVEDLLQCPFCSRAFHYACIEEQLVCDACDERVLWPRTGSEEYLDLLECLHPMFASGQSLFVNLDGANLTAAYFENQGFEVPIKVKDKVGLELQVPPSDFTIDDVIRYCGPELKVDVINVKEQRDQQMTLEQFGDYFKHKDDTDDIFNLISLEISDTQLVHIVKPPRMVKELSWVSTASHDEIKEQLYYNIDLSQTEFYPFGQPQVLRYCLISARNSFTDFHIDFGGTSVWYHLLWGKKVFYMVEPTEKNLDAYEKWMRLPHRDRTHSCFIECVERVYKCEFSEGETIFIPAGWIHAVYTPQDSLVFGGNFLHDYGVPTSLKIYELEKRLNIADRFTFPDYELVNFHAAKNFCELVESLRSVGRVPSEYHLKSMRQLIPRLKMWHETNTKLRQDLKVSEEPINFKRLIKNLQKITKKSNSAKDLLAMKVNFSLREEDHTDEDVNFYCRPKKQRKAPPTVEVKKEAGSSEEEVASKLVVSSSSDTEKFDDSTDEETSMQRIDLKLKAKLIHTLPVQKTTPTKKKDASADKDKQPKCIGGRKRKMKEESSDCKSSETPESGLGSQVKSEASASSSQDEETYFSDSKNNNLPSKASSKNCLKKAKKGCATPKQRLGKLLNIKMR